jgi:O-antigen ligase
MNNLLTIRKPLLAMLAIALGGGIGLLAVGDGETIQVTTSLLVIILFGLLTLSAPLYGFLVWLFGAAMLDSWVELPLGVGLPDLSFNRFTVLFLALTLLLPVVTGRTRLPHMGLTDLCILLGAIGFALAARLSPQPVAVVQTALSLYLIPASAYFFAKHLIHDRDSLHQMFWVIVTFGAFAGACALYEGITGTILFPLKEQAGQRLYRGETNLRLILGVVGSTGGMARVLAITLLVTLYLIMESRHPLLKPWLLVGALFQFGGLLITFSRTPLLALLAALALLQWVYPRLRLLLLVGGLFVALFFAVNWQQIQATEVAQDRFTGVADYQDRSTRWQAGVNMWLERPLWGWGVGHFAAFSGQFRTDSVERNFDAVENDFLYVLVSAGLVGFLPYATFLLAPFWKSIGLFRQTRYWTWIGFIQSHTVVLYWAILLCFLIGSLTARNVQPIVKLLPFALFGAIIGSQEGLLARRVHRRAALVYKES